MILPFRKQGKKTGGRDVSLSSLGNAPAFFIFSCLVFILQV